MPESATPPNTVPDVAIDTNAVYGLHALRGVPSQLTDLLNLLARHGKKLLVHEMVLLELETHWIHKVSAARTKFDTTMTSYGVSVPEEYIEARKAKFLALIQWLRDHAVTHVIPFESGAVQELAKRWRDHLRPFSQTQKIPLGDAIIWLGLLHHLKAHQIDAFAFISANEDDFADSDGSLHGDLAQDCRRLGLTVEYYPSVDAILRRYARPTHPPEPMDQTEVVRAITERIQQFPDWIDPTDPYLYEHFIDWAPPAVKQILVIPGPDPQTYSTEEHTYYSRYAIIKSQLDVVDRGPNGRPGAQHPVEITTRVHFQVTVDRNGSILYAMPLASRAIPPSPDDFGPDQATAVAGDSLEAEASKSGGDDPER